MSNKSIGRRQMGVVAAILFAAAQHAGAADTSVNDVFWWDGAGPFGESTLLRTGSGVTTVVETSGLTDKHTFTVWFVVFNNPDACAGAPCGEADLFDPEVEADVLYAAGHVVGNGDNAHFAGHLGLGDTDGSIAELFGLPNANGLLDAEAAEVHIVVRSHGPKRKGMVNAQINSFDGGCDVDLAPGTVPVNPGECADLQFSIHQP